MDKSARKDGYFRTGAAVFWVFLGCYMVTWGGHYTTGDGAYKVAWAKALMSRGSSIDPVTGMPYSKFGIGQSLLAVPSLAAANAMRALIGIRCEAALYT